MNPRGNAMHLTVVTLIGLALAGAPSRLALLPLSSKGVSPEIMQQLDAAIRIELGRLKNIELIPPEEVKKVAGDGCEERGCLEAVGRALRANEILYGEARGLPDSFAVTLNLLNLTNGRERAASASVNRDVEEMVWATRAQVTQLKAPQRYAGRLALVVPPGGEAQVNGKPVGLDPLVVKPGTHGVKLRTAEKETEAWVEVRFEQTAMVSPGGEKGVLVTYSPWAPPEKVQFANVGPPRELANVPEETPELAPLSPKKVEAAAADAPNAVPASAMPATASAGVSEQAQPWPKWPAYAGFGAGAVLLAVGVVEELQAVAKRDQVEAMRLPGGYFPADKTGEIRNLRDAAASARTLGGVLMTVGGALVLGGGAYLFLAPAPGGGQATVTGSF